MLQVLLEHTVTVCIEKMFICVCHQNKIKILHVPRNICVENFKTNMHMFICVCHSNKAMILHVPRNLFVEYFKTNIHVYIWQHAGTTLASDEAANVHGVSKNKSGACLLE